MMKFVIAVVLVLSAGLLAAMYVEIEKMKRDPALIPVVADGQTKVLLVHSFQDDIHRFAGELKLPHSCYRVASEIIHDPEDRSRAEIKVITTNRILDEKICASITTRYPFEVVIDAPEDLTIKLVVDGKEMPFAEERTQWQSPRGTTVTPI